MEKINKEKIIPFSALLVIVLLLALFSTSEHVQERGGLNYFQEGNQLIRHNDIINNEADSPWQYRILTAYMIESIFNLCESLNLDSDSYIGYTFIFFRVFLDSLILLFSYLYFRKFGLNSLVSLAGIAIVAWSISYSHFNSDLSFNTFLDVVFYLLAAICLLDNRLTWILPITLLAALNRESSGLIPLMVLSFSIFPQSNISSKKYFKISALSFFIYIIVFFGIRFYLGDRDLMTPGGGDPLTLELLFHNLFRIVTWRELLATLSIIPLIAILGYERWPIQLKQFFWVIVPIWIIIHAVAALMVESRLFLVPQVIVFIPGALFAISRYEKENIVFP